MTTAGPFVGRTLGRYRIGEQIGAGGMGVVYRAHDERLERDVALKVLPPGALADEAARKRFRKEALTLSRLNHPNIATVHDFDTQEGIDFLVTELIPGATLAQTLRKRALPEKEILALGAQMAAALEEAHEHGTVHRDFKPGNVMVTSKGQAKVLDFGLAKLLQAPGETAATLSSLETKSVSGTLPYMAPEQLRGEAVDARTDIHALGAVLYEMATGRRPFDEISSPRLTDAILHQSPEAPRTLNPRISGELEFVILKCLEKEPDSRYQSAKEVMVDLRRLSAGRSSASATQVAAPRARKWPRTAILAGAALLALGAAAGVWMALRNRGARAPAGPAEYIPLTNFADSVVAPAISPDGHMLAFLRGENTFLGPADIYVKLLPDGEPKQLTHDGAAKMSPMFSPQGDRIVYGLNRLGQGGGGMDTWSVPVLGGTPKLLLANASGVTWITGEAGRAPQILFSENIDQSIHMGLTTSTESRSESRRVYLPADVYGMAHRSSLSPDHKWVLAVEMDFGGWLPCRLLPFDGSSSGRAVGPAPAKCTDAAWTPDGKWMYFSANAGNGYHIWRQRFPDGAPEQVTSGATEEQGIAFAPDGRWFATAIGSSQSTIWVHDSRGDRQITSEGFGFMPSFSRDGKRLYYLARSAASTHFVSGDLWVADLESGEHQRLLPGFSMEHYDVSPDGKSLVFVMADAAGHSPVWLAALDGSSAPRRLTEIDAVRSLFGPKGGVFFVGGERGSAFLYRINEDGSGLQKVIPGSVTYLYSASPDGKWLAIWQGSTVLLQAVDGGAAITVCTRCGTAGEENRGVTPPMVSWSPDQKFLYLHFPLPNRRTYSIALKPGQVVPPLPARVMEREADLTAALPGMRLIPQARAYGGANPAIYAFPKGTTQRNIYRVPVP